MGGPGLWQRLFGGRASPPATSTTRGASGRTTLDFPRLRLAGDPIDRFGFEVVGESHYQPALMQAIGSATRDSSATIRVETQAYLIPEPDNDFDENAVAVHLASGKVGYFPRASAEHLQESLLAIVAGGHVPVCDAVVVGREIFGVWLNLDDAIEPWTPEHDRSPKDRGGESRPWTGESGSPRSAVGYVRRKHYTDWVEDVRALKRHEAYEEALSLLNELVDAVEREAAAEGSDIAPWYHEQAAITCRKLKDYDGEVEVLERYRRVTEATPYRPRSELLERLDKAIAIRTRRTG